MADNIPLPGTGETVATDQVGGIQYQWIKLKFGADNSVTAVDATNPLPVGTTLGGFSSTKDSGLSAASTATVSTSVLIDRSHRVSLQVDGITGTHAAHVLTLQVSSDNTKWHNTSTTVTGEGVVQAEVFSKYVRAKVTTSEAGSTIDVTLQTK